MLPCCHAACRVCTSLILLTTSPPAPLKPNQMVLPVAIMICRELFWGVDAMGCRQSCWIRGKGQRSRGTEERSTLHLHLPFLNVDVVHARRNTIFDVQSMHAGEITMSALREWAAASGGAAHKVRLGRLASCPAQALCILRLGMRQS